MTVFVGLLAMQAFSAVAEVAGLQNCVPALARMTRAPVERGTPNASIQLPVASDCIFGGKAQIKETSFRFK